MSLKKLQGVPELKINKKSQLEDLFKSNSDLLKNIFNNFQDIIILYNLHRKKILFISKNITNILNYNIKDIKSLTNEDIHYLMHSGDFKEYKKIDYQKNKDLCFEYRLKINNTRNYKWFKENILVLEKDNFDQPYIILYTLKDISAYKELEKKLSDTEDKLKDFEKLQDNALWELDITTNKITFTKEMSKILELEEGKKINKNQFLKYIYPEDLKNFKASLLKLAKGIPQQITLRVKLKSGNIKYLLSNLKPITNKKNKVTKISAISIDISEKKLAESKLREYTKELKELNRSKDKYFSIIAHDLRGPFTSLLGFSNLLKEEFDFLTREEVKHYISLINSSSKNIYSLIENLLQWTRLQTGRLVYQPENVNLNSIIDEVVMLYKAQASTKNLDIVIDIQNEIYVYADINMLKSVLQNLVSNSIKFSEEGGKIILSVEENNNKYTISVSDTGIGIPPEVVDKLFKIDFHYSTPGTRDEKGSGLGLILCKEFISKHGSEIKVKSEPKIGTTISFDLKKGKNTNIKKNQ